MSRKLHIGGTAKVDGWELTNITEFPGVDFIGDCTEFKHIPDGTYEIVYSSHVFEHLDYRTQALKALREWYRILKPGGIVMISVPDLQTIGRLMANAATVEDEITLMRMFYGGHVDRHDYHFSGWTARTLETFLAAVGFTNARRAEVFGIFNDTSGLRFNGQLISLNVLADKV